jgi:hypothetical protein
MNLAQCELEAAKNNATIFFSDSYQHPSPGDANFWRYRETAAYGITGIWSTYPETSATTTKSCGLFRPSGATQALGQPSYTAPLADMNTPWTTGTANGYTYRIYRAAVSSFGPSDNLYECSLWLRVNGLNVYGQGTQAMLSGLTATMTNGFQGLCEHGNCGQTWAYIQSRTYTNAGDGTSAIQDGFCYGYTIYSN